MKLDTVPLFNSAAAANQQLQLATALIQQQQQINNLSSMNHPLNVLLGLAAGANSNAANGTAFEGLPIYLVPGATSLPSIPKVETRRKILWSSISIGNH